MNLKVRTAEATLRMSLSLGDVFPAVLATSRMIELMELAALRLMRQHLGAGESSVSIEMKMTHVAPTIVGGMQRAVASHDGVSGRLHRFTINVFDESGLIGSARHTRAVVTERKLLGLARRRAGKSRALPVA
jgi:fluoroacetyl-CoA thioesterase